MTKDKDPQAEPESVEIKPHATMQYSRERTVPPQMIDPNWKYGSEKIVVGGFLPAEISERFREKFYELQMFVDAEMQTKTAEVVELYRKNKRNKSVPEYIAIDAAIATLESLFAETGIESMEQTDTDWFASEMKSNLSRLYNHSLLNETKDR